MTTAAFPPGHMPDLLELARLFERTIEYEIRRSIADGDDEGARLKWTTLNMVRVAIRKATTSEKERRV
jgi:hypothetical protein